jgi:hypothetical protein
MRRLRGWHEGGRDSAEPVDHLSADRIADIGNANQPGPLDLETLRHPLRALKKAQPDTRWDADAEGPPAAQARALPEPVGGPLTDAQAAAWSEASRKARPQGQVPAPSGAIAGARSGAVATAGSGSVAGARSGAVAKAGSGAVATAGSGSVAGARSGVVGQVLPEAGADALSKAQPDALSEAQGEALSEAQAEALSEAVAQALPDALAEALPEAVAQALPDALAHALPEAVAQALPEAVAHAQAEAEAVAQVHAQEERAGLAPRREPDAVSGAWTLFVVLLVMVRQFDSVRRWARRRHV